MEQACLSTLQRLTHVGFIFRHGGHSILVCCKLDVCLPRHPAIWADFNMDPYRIQRGEKLKQKWRCLGKLFSLSQLSCRFSSDVRCRCPSLLLCTAVLSYGHSGPLYSGKMNSRRRSALLNKHKDEQNYRRYRIC